jgi:hypothetical protein
MLAAVAVGLALAASPGARTVGCDEVIAAAPFHGRLVLAAAVVPPAHITQSTPTESTPWTFFSKWGLVIRAGAGGDVSVTVPAAWRRRVAISWGNNQHRVFHTLRFRRCAGDAARGSVYAGGFFLRRAAECVPLRVRVGTRTRLVWFGIVRRCG